MSGPRYCKESLYGSGISDLQILHMQKLQVNPNDVRFRHDLNHGPLSCQKDELPDTSYRHLFQADKFRLTLFITHLVVR
jgi:hypothetical protein